MAKYIYEYDNWPAFTWRERAIDKVFGEVRHLQGKILGEMAALGFSLKEDAILSTLSTEVVKSSEIEGELLNFEQVRSSIARQLGINTGGLEPGSRYIEGVVEMMLDATQNYNKPLTHKRLYGWHSALFPTGYSGAHKIETGRYRSGAMQVVSGAMGKEKVHYEAIKAQYVKGEMDKFLKWVNADNELDPVIKAGIAHFWFIIIHPFDDGNGRIARAITELLLSRSESSGERFYSMSGQILNERKLYYSILQEEQYSSGDITRWLEWFLNCLKNAMLNTETRRMKILQKASFWKIHEHTSLNYRQRIILNRLLDGFEGKLQSSKWAKITKSSTDTALRDIKDLIEKGILQPTKEGGRSAGYELTPF